MGAATMDGAIALQQIVTFGGFLLALFGAGFGLWKYFEGKIERAKSDAALAVGAVKVSLSETQRELSAHKLHVAETFVTKQGMSEQTAQIMAAINGVSGKLDHLGGRIDALYSSKPASRARSTP